MRAKTYTTKLRASKKMLPTQKTIGECFDQLLEGPVRNETTEKCGNGNKSRVVIKPGHQGRPLSMLARSQAGADLIPNSTLPGNRATLIAWPPAKPEAKSACGVEIPSCSQGCEQGKKQASEGRFKLLHIRVLIPCLGLRD